MLNLYEIELRIKILSEFCVFDDIYLLDSEWNMACLIIASCQLWNCCEDARNDIVRLK